MSKSTAAISNASEGSVHLDAIRGAAALLVFLNHTRALYFSSSAQPPVPLAAAQQMTSSPFNLPPDHGFGEIKLASEAVIIFFVLSGYLVGGSVLRLQRTMRWSWRVYLTKRLTRLYVVLIPALLLGTAFDYLGSHWFGAGSVYTAPRGLELVTTVNLAARLHPLVLLGNALFLTNIRVPYPGTNVALWSLANEFWYYLAFPMLLLAFMSKPSLPMRLVWAAAACAVLVFSGREVAVLFPIWVMAGVRLLRANALAADFCIGIATSFFLYVVVQQVQPAKNNLYRAGAGFFSRISYTLYLFHVPMAMFLSGLLNSPWHSWQKTPGSIAAFAAIDLLIVGCCYGLWKLFEANTDIIRALVFERELRINKEAVQ